MIPLAQPITLSAENPIETLTQGVDVIALAQALEDNPQLWNQHRLRTEDDGPHRETSDIWVRCMAWDTMQKCPGAFNYPHESVWYPAGRIKAVQDAVLEVLRLWGGGVLGGVLITKIPSGGIVYPHVDKGWHARAHQKVALQVAANPQQSFCFKAKQLVTAPGDIFLFDNSFEHWVHNPSKEARITMICCIRDNRSTGGADVKSVTQLRLGE